MNAPNILNAELAAQLQALFVNPDRAAVPSGVLSWFGPAQFPDGVSNVPVLDQNAWAEVYTRLESAAITAGVIAPLQALLAQTKSLRPDERIPIAITHVQLAVPDTAFAERMRGAMTDNRPIENAPVSLAEVLTTARAFAASAVMHDQYLRALPCVRGRSADFYVSTAFHTTNAGSALPDTIEIDAGDGFRAVEWDESVHVSVSSPGNASIAVRCRYGDDVLTARCSVCFSDDPAAPRPNDTWQLAGFDGNSGVAYVFLAPANTQLTHPFIVAEGFPGGYPTDYIYDALSGNGLLAALQAKGYDLVVVSYNGLDLIQKAATIYEAALLEALARARKMNADAKVVAGGVSMGGLVSRYALASMETRGVDHGVRLWFTVDTPHGGAYTGAADQWLLHFLKPVSSLARTLTYLIDSPANQQFMMFWAQGSAAVTSPLRAEFLADLQRVGNYPQKVKRIAVANGRGDGKRETPAGALMLRWSGSALANAELRTLYEDGEQRVIGSGYCLLADASTPPVFTAASKVSWDGAPGGSNVYNAMAAEVVKGTGIGELSDVVTLTAAIPTLCALDIDPEKHDVFAPVPPPGSGASPFHDYLCGIENTRHISITAETSVWLADRIGDPE